MNGSRLSLAEMHDLTARALVAAGTLRDTAHVVADALVAAEADGQAGHGISRLAGYADQVRSGKVDGRARPSAGRPARAAVAVDARCGFAYPAIALGTEPGAEAAAECGVAMLVIGNSHHSGMAGYHVERLARRGLMALAFGNAPAAIAPHGGSRPLFGTNPIAFACPRTGDDPLVIDLSLSKVARGRVMVAAKAGEPIPKDWAVDSEGRPTTDARAALSGAMLPIGDAKGAALAMMVEILATCLSGANFGFEASSFFDAEGPPPGVGQLFVLISPEAFGATRFAERVEALCAAVLAQGGTRLPGDRRYEARRRAAREGVVLPDTIFADLVRRAGPTD